MKIREYWNKLLDFFGLYENIEENKEVNDKKLNNFTKRESKVVSLNRKQDIKLILYRPHSYDQVKDIVDDLKARRPVILNLEKTDKNLARRLIDFISGAVYAINGNVQKAGNGVFLFTPSNIEINGKDIETIDNSLISDRG